MKVLVFNYKSSQEERDLAKIKERLMGSANTSNSKIQKHITSHQQKALTFLQQIGK